MQEHHRAQSQHHVKALWIHNIKGDLAFLMNSRGGYASCYSRTQYSSPPGLGGFCRELGRTWEFDSGGSIRAIFTHIRKFPALGLERSFLSEKSEKVLFCFGVATLCAQYRGPRDYTQRSWAPCDHGRSRRWPSTGYARIVCQHEMTCTALCWGGDTGTDTTHTVVQGAGEPGGKHTEATSPFATV